MKKLLLSSLIVLIMSCSEEDPSTSCAPADRIGAKCMDGTNSTATGSGACSSHGGVDYWICK